jgi:hypothetical protein
MDIRYLLSATPHRLSREVQFTLLVQLDSLTMREADIRELLPSVEAVLYGIRSSASYVPMMLGCLLGGGWYKGQTRGLRRLIENLLIVAATSVKHVHGRYGALHGLEHVLNNVSLQRGIAVLDVIQEVALRDRAVSQRRRATTLLQDGYWWGNSGLPELHRYARKLGRDLTYP